MGPGELATQYVRLTSTAVQTQWRLAREYAQASSQLAKQGTSRPAATTTARSATQEAARWWREAAELALSYGQSLVDLNRESGERVVRTLASARTEAPGVVVTGASGATVREPITVANTRSTRQHVTFAPGPLRGADGTTTAAAWSFEPAELDLEPGEEQRVVMALPLVEELFPAGSSWTGHIGVQHEDGVVLELAVQLDVR